MILDSYLINQLEPIGKRIMKHAGLKSAPNNIEEMYKFLKALQNLSQENDDAAALVCEILFSFVTSEEVRDRHTSPREFEDIFCSLFGTVSTDTIAKSNPKIETEIAKYDCYSKDENWNISTDLSGNKREKADVFIGNYALSLKTLKGKSVDSCGIVTDKRFNNEINVGSFSFRALFKGILSDEQLMILRDRKGGLGSGSQIRENVLKHINSENKNKLFLERLKDFLKYVYADDLLILIKSNYMVVFYLIPSYSFVESICKLYEHDEKNFEKVWYRWENNNLRFPLNNFINNIREYNLPIYEININLAVFEKNNAVRNFNEKIRECIQTNIENL